MKTSQEIYKLTKNKTRVVILGSESKTIIAMVLFVMNYHERNIDVVLENSQEIVVKENNDFVIIEASVNTDELNANIALMSSNLEADNSQLINFINSITNGGILIYNEEDHLIKELVEKSTHPIQKYPYQTPKYTVENEQLFLDTNEGKLPLEVSENELQNLAGVKWICQHIAIDEDDFYEAISTYSTIS